MFAVSLCYVYVFVLRCFCTVQCVLMNQVLVVPKCSAVDIMGIAFIWFAYCHLCR